MANYTLLERFLWVYRHEGVLPFLIKKLKLYHGLLVDGWGLEILRTKVQREAALQVLIDQNEFQAVLEQGYPLLEHFSKYGPFFRLVGTAELRLGNFDAAEELFEKARPLDRKQGRALSSLGIVAWKKGESARAKLLFEEALTYRDADVSVFAAWISLEKDGGRRKELLIRAVSSCQPDSQHSLTWLRLLSRYASDKDVATLVGEKIAEYMSVFPDDTDAESLLIELQVRQKGVSELDSILKSNGFEEDVDHQQCLIIARALKHLFHEGLPGVEERYLSTLKLLIECYPKDKRAYFDLGRAIRNRETADGFRPFEKSPAKLQALDIFLAASDLGGVEGQQAEVSALEMLLRMREQEPFERNAERLLGLEKRSARGLEAAAATYFSRKRDFKRASELRNLGIKRDGRTHDHVLALGQLSLAAGEYVRAYEHFKEAQALRPGVNAIERCLAETEFELGDIVSASARVARLRKNGQNEKWMDEFEVRLQEYQCAGTSAVSYALFTLARKGVSCLRDASKGDGGIPLFSDTTLVSSIELPESDWTVFLDARETINEEVLMNTFQSLPAHVGYLFDAVYVDEADAVMSGTFLRRPTVIVVRTEDLSVYEDLAIADALEKLMMRLHGQFVDGLGNFVRSLDNLVEKEVSGSR